MIFKINLIKVETNRKLIWGENMAYIEENKIIDAKEKIEFTSKNLLNDVTVFQEDVKGIEEVIAALMMCINTTGGTKRVNELKGVEFNPSNLMECASKVGDAKISYTKGKRYLS